MQMQKEAQSPIIMSVTQLYSVKLITGEQVITELYDSDDSKMIVMINPFTVISHEGTMHKTLVPFDETTDEELFEIPESMILTTPVLINQTFRTHYVRALIYFFLEKEKALIVAHSPEEFAVAMGDIEKRLNTITPYLEEKYGIALSNLQDDDDEDENPEEPIIKKDPNKLLH